MEFQLVYYKRSLTAYSQYSIYMRFEGRPELTLAERVLEAVPVVGRTHVSISHDGDYAVAQVVFESQS